MSFLASLSQSLCSKAKGKRQKAKKGRGRSSFSLFPFSFCLPPQLEILEERTLLATLPVPQVSGQQVLLDPRLVATTASVLSPAVAIDPINPNKMVAVEVVNITAPAPAEAAIDLQYSTDGGKTWTDYLFAFGSFAINPQIDPTTITNTNPGVPFVQANFPSVGFDRNENVYVLGVLHNAANNSGAMQFSKFNFSGVFPAAVSLDTTLYGWTRDDPVINASMAVNTNLPTFTDPDTGRVQQDGLAGDIAIVWNTNLTPPSPAPAVFNPSVIKLMVSSDGGNSFTPAVTANDVGTSSNTERDANPQVAFIQGSSSGNLPGGGLILAWNNYFQINTNRGPVNQLIVDASRPGHITSAQFNGTTGLAVGPIGDAGAGTPNVPAVTTLQLPVNITDTNFTTLTDLTVTLNIVHPHLNQLRIELIAPDPNNPNDPTKNGPILRLINEGIDAAGNVIMGQGLPDAANLGVMNGMDEGTILDSLAARSIRDPGATAPYVGTFRPEGNLLNWIQLNGFTRTTINGIWKLRITDMRNDGNTPPVQRVDSWSLNFASSFANFTNGLGLDQSIAFLPGTSTPALNVLGDNNNNYPLKLPVSTTEGIGPGIALAVDNTLGSFSPFSGRAYLAYTFRRLDVNLNPTNNTDIILIASDDGGFSWNALTPSVDP
ncbi:MAG TPA: hypothetical protein VFA18_21705, partial [Gemmataceae bacterium]|nr:hypothetical protein [Gemmataceae bacterium]